MAYDIGPKIGIEGEKEFRQNLQMITTRLRTLGTEMQAVTSQFDKEDNSMAAVTARKKVLTKQIDEQKQKLDELRKGLAAASDKYGENNKVTQKWQAAVNKATADLNNMQRELDQSGKKAKQSGEDAKRGLVGWDKLRNGMGGVGRAAATATKAMVVGLTAFAGVTAAALKGGYDLAIMSSDLGEAQNVINQTFEENAESVNKWAGSLQKAYGIGQTEGTKMVGTFAAILKGSGLQEAAFMDMSKGLTQLTGDYASFYNVEGGATQVAADFKSALAGSAETLQKYGIVMTNATLNEFARQQGMSKTFEKMSLAEKQQLRYNYIMAQSKDVVGDFGRTVGDSLPNQIRVAKLQLQDIGTSLGQIFMPAVSGAISGITDLLGQIKSVLSDGFQGSDIRAIGMLITSKLVDGLKSITEYLPDIVDTVSEVLSTIIEVIVITLPTLVPALADGLISLMESSMKVLGDNAPDLADTAVLIIRKFADFLMTALPLVAKIAAEVIPTLVKGIARVLPQLARTAMEILPVIVKAILDALPTLVQTAIDIILAVVNGLTEALPELIPAAVEAIITIVQTLYDNMPALIDAAIEMVLALVEGIINSLPILIEAMPKLMKAYIEGIVNALPMLIDAAKQILTSLTTAIIDNLPMLLEATVEIIMMLATGLVEAIPELLFALPEIFKAIRETLQNMDWGEIGGNILRGIADGVTKTVKNLVDAAKRAARAAMDGVKSFLGIKSPSTKMRDEVGVQMAYGVGGGFVQGMRRVIGQMQSAMRGATAGLSGNVNMDLTASMRNANALAAATMTRSGGVNITYAPVYQSPRALDFAEIKKHDRLNSQRLATEMAGI